jgi:hypothetical protein
MSKDCMVVNNELERTWKEAVMATFNIFLEELRKTMKNRSEKYSLPMTSVCVFTCFHLSCVGGRGSVCVFMSMLMCLCA